MAEPVSLMEVLSEVPDPRDAQGLRHPLPSILSLTVLAILAGMRGPESIAQFGRDHGARLAWALGFRRSKTPCKSTLSTLFRALDVEAFEAALRRWIAGRMPLAEDDAPRIVSIDGKRLRGSRDGEAPGVHLLAAYAPQASAVLAQLRVEASTNEHKAALELLGILPLENTVITGDAIFCQRDVCETITAGGGDYIFPVKENQPELLRQIVLSFGSDEPFSPLRAAKTCRSAEDRRVHDQRTRPPGAAKIDHQHAAERVPGLARRWSGLPSAAGAADQRQDQPRDGLWHYEPGAWHERP